MTRETKSYELKIYDQSLMRFEAAYDAFGSLKLDNQSSNSPSKCLTNLFSPLLRHRKSSRNTERTTKRSTFRLLLKSRKFLSPHATIYGYVK